jgi:hypothetical protein
MLVIVTGGVQVKEARVVLGQSDGEKRGRRASTH